MRKCSHCGEPTDRPKFCSRRCNSAAKYERYKADGTEAEKRARRNAKYNADPVVRAKIRARQQAADRAKGALPQATGDLELCPVCSGWFDGWRGKKFCSVACRRIAKSARYRARRNPGRCDLILSATVDGTTRRVIGTVIENGGLWVYCPSHPGQRVMMHIIDYDSDERACVCGVTLTLNREGEEWATFEALSTTRLSQAVA